MTKVTSYGYGAEVSLSFAAAQEKLIELLAAEGFGVLSTIDIRAKIKEKLGKEMEDYVILGACNPPTAAKALETEIEIGLLLPCNIIVYRKNGKTFVSAIMPAGMMKMIGNKELDPIAEHVETKLRKIIDRIAASSFAQIALVKTDRSKYLSRRSISARRLRFKMTRHARPAPPDWCRWSH